MWAIDEDDARALLTVKIDEDLNDHDLTRMKLALKQRMAKLRARHGKAHILFDFSSYVGSGSDVVDRFQHVDGEFVQSPADRVALLLRDSLGKAQTRALLHYPDQSALFVSAQAARTWLDAG